MTKTTDDDAGVHDCCCPCYLVAPSAASAAAAGSAAVGLVDAVGVSGGGGSVE